MIMANKLRLLILILVPFFLSIQLGNAQCTEDCVWSGDLNANGIANNLDFLMLGFALDSTGPARANMSTDWEALDADDWVNDAPLLNTNFKHIDANGNGVIEFEDRLPILINYEKTNSNFIGQLGNEIEGDDLFAVLIDSVATPSGSLIFDVHLGKDNVPIEDIYGIGFQIKMDTQYVESVNVDFSDTWIGAPDDILAFDKYSPGDMDHSGIAITRYDGTPVSGFGKIARVEIVITDVVLGLVIDTTACLPFDIKFENVLGVTTEGTDMLIESRNDSMTLKHPSQITNTRNLNFEKNLNFKIFPNPTEGILHIENENNRSLDLIFYNQIGMVVLEQSINNSTHQINLEDLPRGIYFVKIKDEYFERTEKIILK